MVEQKIEEFGYGLDEKTVNDITQFVSEYRYMRQLIKENIPDMSDSDINMLFSIWRKDKRVPADDTSNTRNTGSKSNAHNKSKPRKPVDRDKLLKRLYAKLKAKQEAGAMTYEEVNEIYHKAKTEYTVEEISALIYHLKEEGY